MDYRVGDVLRVSCPFTTTVVTGVSDAYLNVRWPWWEIDPEADGIRWNGEVAVGIDDPDELYTTDPPARRLGPGDACRVGIAPRVVHVIEVQHFDPPQPTGWLPRPHLSLLVLRAGEAVDPDAEFQGTSIEPDGGIPFGIGLEFRPYAYLEIGDDVIDADSRAWRFDGPWTWAAYDGVDGVPAWPLTLLAGNADPAAVAAATTTGSHGAEALRWRWAAGLSDRFHSR